MKSLSNTEDRAQVLARLERVTPDSQRRWGRMSAHQMVVHLSDSFRTIMGDKPVLTPAQPAPRWRQPIMKFVALQLPFRWPHGVRTRPDIDSERGGTPPAEFAADVEILVDACERFATGQGKSRGPHFLFGPLTNDEWSRWGYRHMDHHLSQFGV